MAGAPTSVEGEEPNFEEPSHAIDCPVSVLASIRAAVLERFNSTPHGGEEVTGVLFGTRTTDEVRVTAFCPVAGATAQSQAEALSDAQHAMSAVISASGSQEALAGLEPLGWFRSHPRCDLNLTERDLELANALFPQPWQIGLVMRPGNSAVTRARFYYREGAAPWSAECAVREFTLAPADLQPANEGRGFPETALSTEIREGYDPKELERFPNPALERMRPMPRRRSWRWPLTLLGAAAVAGGIYLFTESQALSLRVSDNRGELRIAWDRESRAVRDGKSGHLEIVDGGQKVWMELDPEQLRVGNVTCARQSNDVTVRLVVQPDSGQPVEEVARFVGYGAPPTPAPAAENQPVPGSAAGEPPVSRKAEAKQTEQPQELVVPVPLEKENPVAPAKARPKFQEPQTQANRIAPVVSAPPPELAPATQIARNAPAPVAASPFVPAAPPVEKPAAPRTANANAAPANLSAVAPAHVAAARVPASGRVIWIGRLQKNQAVTITGKNSSVGTITGELPGRAFRFSISPGDLVSDGIVLYTSNMHYANSVVEPPGAENGWNKTVYTWNPKVASDVSVEEAPSAQNGWRRMTLRSKNPKISVIVIDWTTQN